MRWIAHDGMEDHIDCFSERVLEVRYLMEAVRATYGESHKVIGRGELFKDPFIQLASSELRSTPLRCVITGFVEFANERAPYEVPVSCAAFYRIPVIVPLATALAQIGFEPEGCVYTTYVPNGRCPDVPRSFYNFWCEEESDAVSLALLF